MKEVEKDFLIKPKTEFKSPVTVSQL